MHGIKSREILQRCVILLELFIKRKNVGILRIFRSGESLFSLFVVETCKMIFFQQIKLSPLLYKIPLISWKH